MGDYISREKLLADIENSSRSVLRSSYPAERKEGAVIALAVAAGLTKNSPAADVAPVRHGHWRGKPTGRYEVLKCSVCGDCSPTAGIMPRFCPNCGAKMDLEG